MSLNTLLSRCLAPAALAITMACGGGGGSKNTPDSGAGSGTVTVIPPQYTGLNSWVAYQDGNGPWKVASASGGQFTFTVTDPAGRYGAMVVINDAPTGTPGFVYGLIYHLTRTEVPQIDLSSWKSYDSVSVSGTIVGTTGSDAVALKMRDKSANLPAGSSSFTVNAPVGQADFIAIRKPGGGAANALVLARNLSITGADPIPAVDFGLGWTLQPQMAYLSGTAAIGEVLSTYVNWITPTTVINLANTSGSSLAFNAVPTAKAGSGDFHFVGGQAFSSTFGTLRRAGVYTKAASGITPTLPPLVNVPSFGIASTTPYIRPVLSWAPLPNTKKTFWYAYDTSANVDWSLTVSAGWLAGVGSASYTFPDLSDLAGWNNAWGFSYGRTLSVYYSNSSISTVDPGWFTGGARSFQDGASYWISDLPERNFVAGIVAAPSTAPAVHGPAVGCPDRFRRHAEEEPGR